MTVPLRAALVVLLCASGARAQPQEPKPLRVGVLGFKNTIGLANRSYLESGIQESLISGLLSLAPARRVQVLERAYFEGLLKEARLQRTGLVDAKNAGALSRLLKADLLLSGEFDLNNDRIVIRARLTDLRTGQPVASDMKVEGPYDELFDLDEKLCLKVFKELKLAAADKEAPLFSTLRHGTTNQDAYAEYVAGRDALIFGTDWEGQLQSALAHFEKAEQLDPAYALAMVGTAQAAYYLAVYNRDLERYAKSLEMTHLAMKRSYAALKLMPELPQALGVRAIVLHQLKYFYQGLLALKEKGYKFPEYLPEYDSPLELQRLGIDDAFKRALAANPYAVDIITAKAANDFVDEAEAMAIREARDAIEAEPLFLTPRLNLANYYLSQDRTKMAEKTLIDAETLAQDNLPVLWGMAEASRQLSKPERAGYYLDRAFKLQPDNPITRRLRAVLKQDAGDWEAAVKEYDEAVRLNPEGRQVRLSRGLALEKLGRPEKAREDYYWILRNWGSTEHTVLEKTCDRLLEDKEHRAAMDAVLEEAQKIGPNSEIEYCSFKLHAMMSLKP